MENGIERGDLFHQPVGQLLTSTDRQRRNVVDRLLRIELGALASRLVENIDKYRYRRRVDRFTYS